MLETGCLALVVRAGAGYNTIDVETASRLGIYVANCPGKNSVAVAELALGLLLALDRRIVDNVVDLRAGKWNKKEYSKAAGLMGRTLGVIGLGNIGREVVHRARAFGMHVVAWSRSLTDEGARRWRSHESIRRWKWCASSRSDGPFGSDTRHRWLDQRGVLRRHDARCVLHQYISR